VTKRFKKGDVVWFCPRDKIFERGIGLESRFGRLAAVVGEPISEGHDYWLRMEFKTSALIPANDDEVEPLHAGACCEFDHLRYDIKP
jgi:hypothetical protein